MLAEVTFGEWLRRRRKAGGLTQAELAQQINCSTSMLKKMESEQRRPSEQIIEQLAKALDIPTDEQATFLSFARGNWSVQPPEFVDAPWRTKDIPSHDSTQQHNIPTQLTSFIGREEEITAIIGKLESERLLTLTGPGGTGKTRTSIQVAYELLDHYPDGIWMVELAPIFDPLLVPRITAIALGLPEESQRPVIDMLCDYLRDRKMLILLDNCEHLIESCAQMADTLLSSCPQPQILATSRESLGITGEITYLLPPLKVPEAQDVFSIEVLSQSEAVRLFVERAIAAKQDFNLTDENASFIAQICDHLDGIPLAIELAASKIRALSPQQIAQRLDERFNLLIDGSRTALPRHQTLQAAIEWSYELLPAYEQALFRRLSIFFNGWTLEAAESVCSDPDTSNARALKPEDILNLLAQLINKSLVTTEEKNGEIRYHMLETIRQYADMKLEKANKKEPLQNLHLAYFLQLAETAEPHLLKPEQLEWLGRLDADYENLRAAIQLALNKESPEIALRLCAAMGRYWNLRGYWLEGLEWLAKALAMPVNNNSLEEKTARIKALNQDTLLAESLDDLERMKESAELSITLAKEHSNIHDFAIAQFCMGFTFLRHRNYGEAESLFTQSLAKFRKLQDFYWEALTYSYLGNALVNQGELDSPKYYEWISRTIALSRKVGERYLLAFNLCEYSHWYSGRGHLDEAESCLDEADSLFKQIGGKYNPTIIFLAQIAQLKGDYQTARTMFLDLREHLRLLGEKSARLYVSGQLGYLEIDEGNLNQAQIYLDEALEIVQELEDKVDTAFIYAMLCRLSYLQGDLEKSKRELKESIVIAKDFSEGNKFYLLELSISSPLIQQSENLVKLLGMLEKYDQENESLSNPVLKRYYNQAKAHAREKIGSVAYKSVYAEGQKMSLDDALDMVLKCVDDVDVSEKE